MRRLRRRHIGRPIRGFQSLMTVGVRGFPPAAMLDRRVRGWHPLMRAKAVGKFRPNGWHGWYTMERFAARKGARFAMAGTTYKGERLDATLLTCWDERHDEPWLLLTDLPPGAAHPC